MFWVLVVISLWYLIGLVGSHVGFWRQVKYSSTNIWGIWKKEWLYGLGVAFYGPINLGLAATFKFGELNLKDERKEKK